MPRSRSQMIEMPLKIAMKEGVGLSSRVGYVALLNRAPHPNTAKVFINWFLSREGQDAYQRVQFQARGLPLHPLHRAVFQVERE